MAIVKAVTKTGASIGRVINYVTRDEKTEEKLISGIECNPQTAIDEMKATKSIWDKEDGRQYKHFIHSFPPDEKITVEQAHEMAVKLCEERFKGFEVLVATHRDTDHIHSHIIVNSVSYEDGRKLQWEKKDLAKMKRDNDRLCREQGLSVPQKGQEATTYDMNKYKAMEKAISAEYKSYVLDCYQSVMAAKEEAVSREDFIEKMKAAGWETTWKDSKKHITFTDKDGNKVRASNIEKTFKEPLTKEDLTRGFESNAERERIISEARTAATGRSRGLGADKEIDGQSIGTGNGKTAALVRDSRAAIGQSKSAIADSRTETETTIRDSRAASRDSAAERGDRDAAQERLAVEAERRKLAESREPDERRRVQVKERD